MSFLLSDTTRVARLGAYRKPRPNLSPYSVESCANSASAQPPEMLSFIERQEEYIEQLEKESQYCRVIYLNLILNNLFKIFRTSFHNFWSKLKT